MHNCAGINRLPSSTKGARCCPANEVQHENISSRRKEPPWRSLTGARRSRCPAVKLRALAIKPNVNCVIAPCRGSVLGTRGGRDRAISCFLTARIPFLSSRCYPFPLRPRRARGNVSAPCSTWQTPGKCNVVADNSFARFFRQFFRKFRIWLKIIEGASI